MALLAAFTPAAATSDGSSDLELAQYWAPVWMQDVDDSNPRADFITRFDFDGDWRGDDNWENFGRHSLPAYVYYSVIETHTHYFLVYADFHPRDWNERCWLGGCHENDLEGLLVVVRKDGSPYGAFQLLITVAHEDFYSYKDYHRGPSRSVRDASEDIDGDVQFYDRHHPYVYVEAKGHGVHGAERWERTGFPGGDGVIYVPGTRAEEPSLGPDGSDRFVPYGLLSMNQLWRRRFDYLDPSCRAKRLSTPGGVTTTYHVGCSTFSSFGTFFGIDHGRDAARAPWGWDDEDDGPVYAGDLYLDPAYVVDRYHDGLGSFSTTYVYASDGHARPAPVGGVYSTYEPSTDRPGRDLRSFDLATAQPWRCRAACLQDDRCAAWTYVEPGVQGRHARCWIKGAAPPARPSAIGVSGVKYSIEPFVDRPGADYRSFDLPAGSGSSSCSTACSSDPRCRAWTFVEANVQGPRARCWLKNGVAKPRASDYCVSGVIAP